MSHPTMRAPSLANRSAAALPMVPPVPVITQTLPDNLVPMAVSFGSFARAANSRARSGDLVLAPIDDQCLAGHESRIVARQERNRSADVARLREALDSLLLPDALLELFRQIPSRPCVSEGRQDGIGGNNVGSDIVRQSPHEVDESHLFSHVVAPAPHRGIDRISGNC